MSRNLPRPLLLLLVAAGCLILAPSSGAAIVTVGSPLTATFSVVTPCSVLCTVASTTLTDPGAQAASPVSGRIVRWHVLKASGGSFRLRVLRPIGASSYLGAGTSEAETPTSTGLETFAANLPVQAGDLVGLNPTSTNDEIGYAFATAGSHVAYFAPPLADGSSAPETSFFGNTQFAFNAEVQPTPTLASLSPVTGPTAGGTRVTLSGTDFEGASAVAFGSIPASGISVDSEGQITATAPPAAAGPVQVTVTTPGGTVSSTQTFDYVAPVEPVVGPPSPSVPPSSPSPPAPVSPTCKVPNLKGKPVSAARKRARTADCKIGKVLKPKGGTGKPARVLKQFPGAGVTRSAGSAITVVIG